MKYIFCTTLALLYLNILGADPLFLTWKEDPLHTMTVVWITDIADKNDLVEYRIKGEEHFRKKVGHHEEKTFQQKEYVIHQADLIFLKPDTTYEFRTDKQQGQFKTAPKELPITFVEGGDVYHDEKASVVKMMQVAASFAPSFAALGGDLAYAFAGKYQKKENIERWFEFLEMYQEHMVTPTGDMIPLLPVLGNHDIQGGYLQSVHQAPFFFSVFPTPGKKGYTAIDFSHYLSLLLLDSGHAFSVEGAQKEWLDQALLKRQKNDYTFAIYHVGAFPSYRSFASKKARVIRDTWVPLFENYKLTAAFEHHDHTLKRTWPIKKQKVDESGVTYFGDGSFGTTQPRTPKTTSQLWYLAFTKSSQAIWVVKLEKESATFKAIDVEGKLIDQKVLPNIHHLD